MNKIRENIERRHLLFTLVASRANFLYQKKLFLNVVAMEDKMFWLVLSVTPAMAKGSAIQKGVVRYFMIYLVLVFIH